MSSPVQPITEPELLAACRTGGRIVLKILQGRWAEANLRVAGRHPVVLEVSMLQHMRHKDRISRPKPTKVRGLYWMTATEKSAADERKALKPTRCQVEVNLICRWIRATDDVVATCAQPDGLAHQRAVAALLRVCEDAPGMWKRHCRGEQ